MKETVAINRPIKIGLFFSIFTIILFEFGVYEFNVPNKLQFYIFLAVCNIAMYIGFTNGTTYFKEDKITRQLSINKIMRFLFWISLVLAIPKFLLFTGLRSVSFSTILYKIGQASTDALSLYMEKGQSGNATGIWRYINWITVLFSPLHWAYIPLSMYYWKNLRLWTKIGTIFIYFFWCAQYIVAGTNVGVFLFVINLGVVFMIKRTSQGKKGKKKLFNRIVVIVIALLTITLLAGFFNMTMTSRIGDDTGWVDTSSLFWILTPPPYRNLVCYFTSYLAHAYQALAYSFSIPFESTYGFGHSFYLLDEFDPKHTWLWPRTYNIKIDSVFHYNWYSQWHTPYVWFANDVSHYGVPIVFFFLFRFFGRAWRRFKETGNIVSFLIFMMYVEFISFISANNQIFQANVTMIAFWILVFLNYTTRKSQFNLSSNAI